MTSRLQLTLFVRGSAAGLLEAVRAVVDPVQAGLIAAHVTLCREDEIAALAPALLGQRLAAARAQAITLGFGAPERFGAHGILMPCIAGDREFQQLRCVVLDSAGARRQSPHITLAHPRNPQAPGNDLAAAASLAAGVTVQFPAISRIRQEGSGTWQVLECHALPPADSRVA